MLEYMEVVGINYDELEVLGSDGPKTNTGYKVMSGIMIYITQY